MNALQYIDEQAFFYDVGFYYITHVYTYIIIFCNRICEKVPIHTFDMHANKQNVITFHFLHQSTFIYYKNVAR